MSELLILTGQRTSQNFIISIVFKEKIIPATEFKAKCLAILDDLDPSGVVVTKHGRPIARILPINPHGNERFIGSMKGKIRIQGDIFTTGTDWDVESRYSRTRRAAQRRSKHR